MWLQDAIKNDFSPEVRLIYCCMASHVTYLLLLISLEFIEIVADVAVAPRCFDYQFTLEQNRFKEQSRYYFSL